MNDCTSIESAFDLNDREVALIKTACIYPSFISIFNELMQKYSVLSLFLRQIDVMTPVRP